jgi:hypothetical protein
MSINLKNPIPVRISIVSTHSQSIRFDWIIHLRIHGQDVQPDATQTTINQALAQNHIFQWHEERENIDCDHYGCRLFPSRSGMLLLLFQNILWRNEIIDEILDTHASVNINAAQCTYILDCCFEDPKCV